MDERLEKALQFSNYITTLNNQRQTLKEKFLEDLLFFIDGCQFTIDRTLIAFVGFMVEKGQTEAVLIDDNEIPAQITNLEEFYNNIVDKYQQASNEYYNSYFNLKRSRTVEKLVEYE
jgi:hypothetical protein